LSGQPDPGMAGVVPSKMQPDTKLKWAVPCQSVILELNPTHGPNAF
jgi:hypothetical protein